MKKIFILESVGELTSAYHPNGGAVVIADDQEQAQELMKNEGAKVTEEEWRDAEIYETTCEFSKVFIFPNAGCC